MKTSERRLRVGDLTRPGPIDPANLLYVYGSSSFVGLKANMKERARLSRSWWVHLPRDAEQQCQKESALTQKVRKPQED